MLAGEDYAKIKQHATDSGWGDLSERQLRVYISRAYSELDETIALTYEQNLSRHLRVRRILYGRALAAGDIRTALAVSQDEAKLLKLYQDQTPEEMERRGVELVLAKLGPIGAMVRQKIAELEGGAGPTIHAENVQINYHAAAPEQALGLEGPEAMPVVVPQVEEKPTE